MKKYKLIIGIDVSKSKLDVCFLSDPHAKKLNYSVVTNDSKGIRKLMSAIKKSGFETNETLFCFENTGIYSSIKCSF